MSHGVGFLDDATAGAFALFGSAAQIAEQINEALDLGFPVEIVVPHPVPTPTPGAPVPRQVSAGLAGSDYLGWFAAEVMPLVGT